MSLVLLQVIRYINSLSWLTVEGHIISYEIVTQCDMEGCSHRPKVEYTFLFDGKQYYGNRYNFGTEMYTTFLPKSYEINQTVLIYYDPINPTDNVLNREIDSIETMLIFMFLSASLWSIKRLWGDRLVSTIPIWYRANKNAIDKIVRICLLLLLIWLVFMLASILSNNVPD